MKKHIKLLLTIFIFTILCLFNGYKVKAANVSISNSQTVTSGQTVTVTATITAGSWNLTLSGGGQSKSLVGQTNTAGNQTTSVSITFNATVDTTVYLKGDITDFAANTSEPVNKSTKINVITTPVQPNNSSSANNNNDNKTPSTSTQTQTPKTEKSNIATLSNLGIKPNDFSGFKANTFSYNTEVANEVEKIEIYASKGDKGQTLTGTGVKTLKEGANAFNIVVTAEDGKTKKTYTINVTRKAKEENKKDEEEQPKEEEKEEKFGLAELKIKELELKPQFQTGIYEYTTELKENIEKLDITLLGTEENSNIEITGNENLQEGENIITITVKGETEEKTATYQIIVNKVIEKKEDTVNVEKDNNKIKKVIIISSAGAIILIIIIVIVINKIKKSKNKGSRYIPYENIVNDYSEEDKTQEEQEQEYEINIYDDETKNKKHLKGKRYK